MVGRYYFFSIFIIVLFVVIGGILFRPEKITVSEYGILFHGNILKKQFHISREDITGVGTKQQTKSIRGAVEYYGNILRIELKNGEAAYISDGNYENYDVLKLAIYEYLRQR